MRLKQSKRFLLVCSLYITFPLAMLAQNSFHIEGKIDSLKDGNKVFLAYQEGDRQIFDSAIVQNSRFEFKGSMQYPVNAQLFLHKNPYVNRPARGENMDYLGFYLEPATMKLTAADSLKNVQISGSPINAENKELNALLKPIGEKQSAMMQEFRALSEEQRKDTQVYNGFVAREAQIQKESHYANLEFIKKHPSSYLSLMRLSYVANQPEVNAEAKKAYELLSADLKNTPLAKDIVTQLESVEKTEIGKIAPDFEQSTPDGKKVKLSDFRSKYVLLDFWASWCGPCRKENPNVVDAFNQYKTKGFTVLGVSLDGANQKEAWQKAIETDQLNWTQVGDLKGWNNEAAKLYGIKSIPANFLIDPSGKIIARDLRGKALHDKLAEVFSGK